MCKQGDLRVENNDTPFKTGYEQGQLIKVAIAHHEGNYFIDEDGRTELEANRQVVVRYCDKDGETTAAANPNGSLGNIAGVCNRDGNVFGLMPHPERVCDEVVGGVDGRSVFESIIQAVAGSRS